MIIYITSANIRMIAQTSPGIKYKILMFDTSDDNKKKIKSIDWAYRSCIAAFKHLRPIIIIDVAFLLGHYRGRLLMACEYDAENKLLPLAFEIVNEERQLWLVHAVGR
jgi:hypothetical protein